MSKQIFETVQAAIDKLEAYGFECQVGTLSSCEDWIIVKAGFYKVCVDNDDLKTVRAVEFHNTQQLRERIASIVRPLANKLEGK